MKAIVTKAFDGVPDGLVHPKAFAKGDVVDGKLAEVAVREKWAKVVEEKPALSAPVPAETVAPPAQASAEADKEAGGATPTGLAS